MKIGILTQPLKINYGGILQAYALQEVLKRMGHDVKTIHIMLYASDKLTPRILVSFLIRKIKKSVFRKDVKTNLFNGITKKEYQEMHKDYKGKIDGIPYILKLENGGTCLVPVRLEE